jgi:hypothetical protein
MKLRMLWGIALVAAIALLVAPTSFGVDAKGPPCGDITAGFFYTPDATEARADLQTPVASCTFVTYTLYVDSNPATEPVSTMGDGTADLGDAGDLIRLSASVADTDQMICVYATSSIGGHVIDRAPDTGCVPLAPGGTGGGGGFQ